MKVKAETIIRTVVLVVALINQILTLFGYSVLPISDEVIAEVVAWIFTTGASVWAWWKNNSFSFEALEADAFLEDLRKSTDAIKKLDKSK